MYVGGSYIPCNCRPLQPGKGSPDVMIWWCCTTGLQAQRELLRLCAISLACLKPLVLGSVPDAGRQGLAMQHVQAAKGAQACLLLSMSLSYMQFGLQALQSCEH